MIATSQLSLLFPLDHSELTLKCALCKCPYLTANSTWLKKFLIRQEGFNIPGSSDVTLRGGGGVDPWPLAYNEGGGLENHAAAAVALSLRRRWCSHGVGCVQRKRGRLLRHPAGLPLRHPRLWPGLSQVRCLLIFSFSYRLHVTLLSVVVDCDCSPYYRACMQTIL